MSFSGGLHETKECRQRLAPVSAFAPVLAPMFATLSPRCLPSSHPQFPFHRDGTDPLCGGHRGSPDDHHLVATRQGGAV
jgi:hypothetical protein